MAAGRLPDDPANRAATALVKICGITDAEGVLAAVRSGADAIGLNLVPGTPRALELKEADAFQRELELGLEVMASKDAKEGPRAFLEKRPPHFTGE